MRETAETVAALLGETRLGVEAALARVRAVCPFDNHIVSGAARPGAGLGTGTCPSHSWPADFKAYYFATGWYRRNAWVATARAARRAFTEAEVIRRAQGDAVLTARLHVVNEALGRFGVGVPVVAGGRAYGGVTFRRRDSGFAPEEVAFLEAAAPVLHRLATGAAAIPDLRLTERECECLGWTSLGKTSWEIGGILGIGEETVNSHLKAAIRKLGAVSRSHAVAEALRRGLID